MKKFIKIAKYLGTAIMLFMIFGIVIPEACSHISPAPISTQHFDGSPDGRVTPIDTMLPQKDSDRYLFLKVYNFYDSIQKASRAKVNVRPRRQASYSSYYGPTIHFQFTEKIIDVDHSDPKPYTIRTTAVTYEGDPDSMVIVHCHTFDLYHYVFNSKTHQVVVYPPGAFNTVPSVFFTATYEKHTDPGDFRGIRAQTTTGQQFVWSDTEGIVFVSGLDESTILVPRSIKPRRMIDGTIK